MAEIKQLPVLDELPSVDLAEGDLMPIWGLSPSGWKYIKVGNLQKAGAVETLAAFKALKSAPDIVFIKGKTAADDGWGGAFMRIAGSVAANDDALVLRRTAGGDSYRRMFDGALHARWFGFKADGLTGSGAANSAALQAAVTAGRLLGCDVIAPPGTAYLASTILFSGQVRLQCAQWLTKLRPTSDAIGVIISVTGDSVTIDGATIDGSNIVSPTFTGVKVNTAGGFATLENSWLYGCGIGLEHVGGNACRWRGNRIQECPVGVKSGGVADVFPGDTYWNDNTIIPTAAGTGWIIDGNTNAQYVVGMTLIGGAIGLNVRGAGVGTAIPDGIIQSKCNYTASSGPVVRLTRCKNFQLNGSVVGGSTGDDGIVIDPAATADVEGVLIDGSQVRANYKRGINWGGGANLQIMGGQCYGNSDGGGSGVYSNVYVGANAKGLFKMIGVMAGLSASGEVFANIQAPAKYGVELAAGALTDAPNYPGRVEILNCTLDGNTVGRISDGSAPTGARKEINNPGGNGPFAWTPSDQSGAGLTFTGVTARYMRIGALVVASVRLTFPSTANGSNAVIGGLPATVLAAGASIFAGAVVGSIGSDVRAILNANATTFQLLNSSGVTLTNAALSGATLVVTLTYFAN